MNFDRHSDYGLEPRIYRTMHEAFGPHANTRLSVDQPATAAHEWALYFMAVAAVIVVLAVL